MGISLVIDGDHAVHRNLHLPNLRGLRTKTGYPTGVIFGVMNILKNLVTNKFDKPIDQVFFLLGKGRGNWRREVYEDYKKKDQEDIDKWYSVPEGEEFSYNEQYEKGRYALEKHLPDLGIRVVSVKNHEADDISYLISKKLLAKGQETIAVSGDGDWLQLVNDPGIPVYRPMKDELITEKNFVDHTGLPPEAMVLHLSVLGGHDNIPQVQYRFGEGSSMKMIEAIDEYTPKAVKEWAEQQSAKTYKGLAEDEKIKQLRTNIKLVDFSKVPFTDEVDKLIEEELRRDVSFNKEKAELFIKKYELARFASILGRQTFKVLR